MGPVDKGLSQQAELFDLLDTPCLTFGFQVQRYNFFPFLPTYHRPVAVNGNFCGMEMFFVISPTVYYIVKKEAVIEL